MPSRNRKLASKQKKQQKITKQHEQKRETMRWIYENLKNLKNTTICIDTNIIKINEDAMRFIQAICKQNNTTIIYK
jgi:hypothetical protein